MAKKKSRINKGRVVGVILYFISAILVVSLFGRFYSIIKRSRDLAAARSELTALQEECKSIQEELDLLDDENYITRYARKNWVYTKKGETVIILPDDSGSTNDH